MKLLAIISEADCVWACLDAVVVAASVDPSTTIDVLHVMVDPEQLTSDTEEIQIQRLREHWEGSFTERAEAAHSAFLEWTAAAGDAGAGLNWHAVTGPEEATIAQAADGVDLLVLARGLNMDSGDARHSAVFASGRPVLLVPDDWRAKGLTSFANIVIGLTDSDVARRTINDAGPWLRAATSVTALRVGNEDDAAVDLMHELGQESISPVLHVVASDGDNLGAQIIAEAHALNADLLVAGAYRHNQFVDWLIGGTTRHMLASPELPLFLAH